MNRTKKTNNFSMTKEQKKAARKLIFKSASKYKWAYAAIIIVISIFRAIQALTPFITQIIAKNLEKGIGGDEIYLLAGAIGFLALTQGFIRFLNFFLRYKYITYVETDTMFAIYKKILGLKLDFFDKNNEGYFRTRMVDDSNQIGDGIFEGPMMLLEVLITFGTALFFIFFYNTIVGCITIGVIALLYLNYITQSLKIRGNFANIRIASDEYFKYLSNSFEGVREIKNYNVEKANFDKYEPVASKFRISWQSFFKNIAIVVSASSLILGAFYISIIVIGIISIENKTMGITEMFALISYSALVQEPIRSTIFIVEKVTKLSVSASRVTSFFENESEQYDGGEIEISKGEIIFKDVNLNYPDGSNALKNIDLQIQPGTNVAFVGGTGSGKSTILKTISKQYLISNGDILIDNQSIVNKSVRSLREQITYMSQESYISFNTIKNNILFGKKDANDDEYYKVTENVDAREFINKYKERDNTMIGPRGVTLSGGQKQRIGLARAFMENNKILLFDEPTSALDNRTEKKVMSELNKKYKNSTILMVAHRLTTIQNFDAIHVMKNGEIIESGKHEELMRRRGEYFNLVRSSID